jgi:ubiquinone/menaquinone biosynthesis C-methylase UbiE
MPDPEAIRAFELAGWQRAAGTYETSFATATRQFLPALLDAAAVGPGRAALDVACGPGFAAAAAVARGATARGLDFSAAMLDVARQRHPAIAFDHGDAEALPYPDGGFDAVVCNFGIHHVPQPSRALREAHRVLRSGGMTAFTVWAAPEDNIAWKLVFDAIRRCGDMAASKAPPAGGGFTSQMDCRATLEVAGFAEVGSRRVDAVWRQANGWALLDALHSGTARMAALIEAQAEDTLPAIATEIDRAAADWRTVDGLAIPIAALVAFGRKP